MDNISIETLANMSLPYWAIPYSLLCLFLVIFGLCTMVSSNTVKKLRHLEKKLKHHNKQLERQHERDSRLNLQLQNQIDRLQEMTLEDENHSPNPP